MEIREIRREELPQLLGLYRQLHPDGWVEDGPFAQGIWEQMQKVPGMHVIVAQEDGVLLSTCTLVLVPNLTHEGRPYGLIESVVTDKENRGRGLAGACLLFAKTLAVQENAYKLMLLTGSKKPSTLAFYEKAGYRSDQKTAFVQWL